MASSSSIATTPTPDYSFINETYSCSNGCIAGIAIAVIVGVILLLCTCGFICHMLHPVEDEEVNPFIKKPVESGVTEEKKEKKEDEEEMKGEEKKNIETDEKEEEKEPVDIAPPVAGGGEPVEAEPATTD